MSSATRTPMPGITNNNNWKIEPELKVPYEEWSRSKSPEATGHLLETLDPLITHATQRYAGSTDPIIKSKARRIVAQELPRYDPTRSRMATHLWSRLQRLQREAGAQRQIVRMPEKVVLEQMRVSQAEKELEDQFTRPPSDQEIADYTGISPKRLRYIRRGITPVSEGRTSSSDEEDGAGLTGVAVERDSATPWLEFVYDDLDGTNQYIMERMLGMYGHEKKPLTQIAKELRVTPAAISQRAKHIQEKINKRQELDLL